MVTKTTLIWSIIIALILGGIVGHITKKNPPANTDEYDKTETAANPDKQIALYKDMRKLWSDHGLWTREYIVAAVNNSPGASAAAARLMKNQEDIGSAVASYYGKDAGDKLTSLLKEHISIAVDIVASAKANDKAKLDAANARWQQNADDIATFLSQANPNWPKDTVLGLMKMHLSTTADELNAVMGKKYDESVRVFDDVFNHLMKMSDALSAGIIKQFPDKFQ